MTVLVLAAVAGCLGAPQPTSGPAAELASFPDGFDGPVTVVLPDDAGVAANRTAALLAHATGRWGGRSVDTGWDVDPEQSAGPTGSEASVRIGTASTVDESVRRRHLVVVAAPDNAVRAAAAEAGADPAGTPNGSARGSLSAERNPWAEDRYLLTIAGGGSLGLRAAADALVWRRPFSPSDASAAVDAAAHERSVRGELAYGPTFRGIPRGVWTLRAESAVRFVDAWSAAGEPSGRAPRPVVAEVYPTRRLLVRLGPADGVVGIQRHEAVVVTRYRNATATKPGSATPRYRGRATTARWAS